MIKVIWPCWRYHFWIVTPKNIDRKWVFLMKNWKDKKFQRFFVFYLMYYCLSIGNVQQTGGNGYAKFRKSMAVLTRGKQQCLWDRVDGFFSEGNDLVSGVYCKPVRLCYQLHQSGTSFSRFGFSFEFETDESKLFAAPRNFFLDSMKN